MMMKTSKNSWALIRTGLFLTVASLAALLILKPNASAVTSQSGSVGIQATIPGAPPSRGATIVVPTNGASFTDVPITVSGLCPNGLLVKLFANNVFVGSQVCANGSYSLQISLFSGRNDLVARVYDALDQAGPDSNTVTVTFHDAQFLQFGNRITLSSDFAERGAAPGSELDWPITITDGAAPYALSVDWGDGTPSDLFSVTNQGVINLKHIYKAAGVYRVIVKATDTNNQSAFLQLVGQGTGAIQSNNSASSGPNKVVEVRVLWWPTLAMIPLILAAFWLGRQHKLHELVNRHR